MGTVRISYECSYNSQALICPPSLTCNVTMYLMSSHVLHIISCHVSHVCHVKSYHVLCHVSHVISHHVSPCLMLCHIFYAISHISSCFTCQIISHMSCLTYYAMSHMSYLNDRYMLTELTGSKESWIADLLSCIWGSIDRKSRSKLMQMLKNSQ